jgi:AcrR family transcriptional regulator
MDGFARRREQSKEEIRRAAWELFSQFGVDKVSIADIARKAGVSQATIYNNFGSKETLAREFVTATVEDLVKRFEPILASKRPYREKMTAFFQSIQQIIEQGNPAAADSTIFNSRFDLLNDPEIKRIREQAQEKMTGLLLDLVRQGKQQGQVNPYLSETTLCIYFTVFMDVFTHPVNQREYNHHPEVVQELGALMLYGLSGKRRS